MNLGWLGDLIAALFHWGAWLVLILLLAGLVYFLVRTYLERRRRAGASAVQDDSGVTDDQRIQVLPVCPWSADAPTFLAEARRQYEQGKLRAGRSSISSASS